MTVKTHIADPATQGDPAATDPPQGDPATVTPPVDPAPTSTDPDPKPSGDSDLVAKLRRIEKDNLAKIRQLEAEKTERERGELAEVDRLKAELADRDKALDGYRAKLRDAALESRIVKAGVDPDFADMAAAALASKVTLDDDGELTGLDEAIAALKVDKPKLFVDAPGAGDPATGVTPPAGSGNLNSGSGQQQPPGPSLTSDELAMAASFGQTPEEYAKNKSVTPSTT